VSKILDQPVTVNLNAQGLLAGFTMGGNAHKVIDVLEEWRDIGCWWDNEGEKVFPIRVGKGFSGLTRTPREVVQLARQKPTEMSWSELQWYIMNKPKLSEGEIRNLQVQLHLKISVPFACFFFDKALNFVDRFLAVAREQFEFGLSSFVRT